MIKKIWIMLFCCITTILITTSCKKTLRELSSENIELDYNIVEYKYCDNYSSNGNFYNRIMWYEKGYYISYPQIKNFKNDEIELLINNELENIAVSNIHEFMSSYDSTVKTTYTVGLNSNNYLSISFILGFFEEHQAYPHVDVKTITFDMQTGEKIKLKEIVNINENFITSFFNTFKNITDYNNDDSTDLEESIYAYVNDLINKFNKLSTCDEESNEDIHSYLTNDSLVICFAIPYSGGAYALYEAKYSDLLNYMIIQIP